MCLPIDSKWLRDATRACVCTLAPLLGRSPPQITMIVNRVSHFTPCDTTKVTGGTPSALWHWALGEYGRLDPCARVMRETCPAGPLLSVPTEELLKQRAARAHSTDYSDS